MMWHPAQGAQFVILYQLCVVSGGHWTYQGDHFVSYIDVHLSCRTPETNSTWNVNSNDV